MQWRGYKTQRTLDMVGTTATHCFLRLNSMNILIMIPEPDALQCNSGKTAWEKCTWCLELHYISCLHLSPLIELRSIRGCEIELSVRAVVFGARIIVEIVFRDVPQNYLESVSTNWKKLWAQQAKELQNRHSEHLESCISKLWFQIVQFSFFHGQNLWLDS